MKLKLKSVSERCHLSWRLFNMWIDEGIELIKRRANDIKINVTRIHCVIFPDDSVLTSDSLKKLFQC